MKSILLSVQPKWVQKILNGEKTIEIRKSAPKGLPVRVYMYCTKGKNELVYFYNQKNYKTVTETSRWGQGQSINYGSSGNGKVVAEYVVDKIDTYAYAPDCYNESEKMYYIKNGELEQSCLTYEELCAYGKGKTLYGLHITDLKVYDKPLELGEFGTFCKDFLKCEDIFCNKDTCRQGFMPLTRPPQSWMYCEEER